MNVYTGSAPADHDRKIYGQKSLRHIALCSGYTIHLPQLFDISSL